MDNVKIENYPGVILDPNAAKARIYVGGLLKKVTDDHLRERFSQYGQILDMVHNSGYAIIQFSTAAAAFEAVHNEDGKPMLTSKKMKVRLAGVKVESSAPAQKPPIYFTSRPNQPQDIEIILFSKEHVEYAEEVLKKVFEIGFQADIMIKKDKFSLYELLEDLKNHSIRAPLMALLIDEPNVRERSVTLQFLQWYGQRVTMSLDYALNELRVMNHDFLVKYRMPVDDIFEKEVKKLYEQKREELKHEMDPEVKLQMIKDYEANYYGLVRRY
ncbi:uncharacterized protein LOC134831452 [Culicoides brevitarsis]|uniref:uncharacterized protein LOC134831452 n=1 Tax=Culicoides brevitarsis TaxID=469753 RepID=UPI00307C95B8